MRYALPFVALAVALLPTPAGASPRILPQPHPVPLGVLLRKAKTVHILKVESVDVIKGVSFGVTKALKGKPAVVPFRRAKFLGKSGGHELFRVGTPVLCIRCGEMAVLHLSNRWAYAVEPIRWRREEDWFCRSKHTEGMCVTYEGMTTDLIGHVAAILAGEERTITACLLVPRRGLRFARLCRIKAGPKVVRLIESDESANFVGWGTGDPKEELTLTDALRAADSRDRIRAANDLAHFGPSARTVIPALRNAMEDSAPSAALAAARAWALIDPGDGRGVEAIAGRLKHPKADVRSEAATMLGELGLHARPSLSALFLAMKDAEVPVRCAVASSVGRLAPGTDAEARAVEALTALLEDEAEGGAATSAVRALREFGPCAWSAASRVRKTFLTPDQPSYGARDAIEFLARLDPPPVEFLAEVLADPRSSEEATGSAASCLVALGYRARLALPRLRRGLASRSDEVRLPASNTIPAIWPCSA